MKYKQVCLGQEHLAFPVTISLSFAEFNMSEITRSAPAVEFSAVKFSRYTLFNTAYVTRQKIR